MSSCHNITSFPRYTKEPKHKVKIIITLEALDLADVEDYYNEITCLDSFCNAELITSAKAVIVSK